MIVHWNAQKDGELSEATMQKKLESLGYTVGKYVYTVGTIFPDHTHDEDKIDAVLSGELEVKMNGNTFNLKTGDFIAIPRKLLHSAKVVGNVDVVSLDAEKK